MSRLKTLYENEIRPQLTQEFNYRNIMEVPRLRSVVLNMGLGEAIQNIKILDNAVEELALIAGQKPVITRAKKSIASFKLRENMPIGCMVTLRRDRMYDFLDKLIHVLCLGSVIFGGFPRNHLTAAVIIPWEYGNTLFFRRSITTR